MSKLNGKINVLVVDDSRFMRGLVMGLFSEMKIDCAYIEAGNGADAFKELQSRHIDLVLLDWNMPQLLGIDFLKQARAVEAFKELPIIMVTSEAAKLNMVEAFTNGVTDYITKPIDKIAFKEKMAEVFEL
ncbi:response regulator [Spirochaetia bacterium]|nr:response regulator [Spirochaetia bacterium]